MAPRSISRKESARDDDDYDEYLKPGFDASILTKPQLRSILARHNVMDLPPSSARKEALIELFDRHIRGDAQEIRRNRSRVRASDRGIAMLDERSQPSPRRSPSIAATTTNTTTKTTRKRRGRSRKPRARSVVDEAATIAQPARSLTRSRTRSRSGNRGRPSVSPTGRVAKSTASPLNALQRALPNYTDSPQQATAKLRTRLEYIADTNNLRGAAKIVKGAASHSASPRTKKASVSRRLNLSPSPRPSSRQKAEGLAELPLTLRHSLQRTRLPLVLRAIRTILYYTFLAMTAIMVGLYIRFKFFHSLPYCDSGASLANFLPPSAVPLHKVIWSSISNMCIPCPLHGTCSKGMLRCAEGYIPVANWVAFGDDCRPDVHRLTLVEDLTSRLRHLLAERAGMTLCGQLEDEATERVLTESQLGKLVRERYPKADWNSAQFDSLFRTSFDEITRNAATFDIAVSNNPIDGTVMLQSTKPIMGVGCRIRRWSRHFYQLHRQALWISGVGLVFLVLLFWHGRERSRTSRRVEELVHAILQILAEQDALHRRDPLIPSSISVPQIRDALFYRANVRQRNRLWPLVCQAIQKNSNVRESVMYLKGEQTKVWEWIGSDVLSPLIRSR